MLGGRCANPSCPWINADGTEGCTDMRCLQIDHKQGGGHQARQKAGNSYNEYKRALQDSERDQHFQVLCANCNWIKRYEQKEFGSLQAAVSRAKNLPLSTETVQTYKHRLYYLWEGLETASDEEAKKVTKQIARLEERLGLTISDLLKDTGFRRTVEGRITHFNLTIEQSEDIKNTIIAEPQTPYQKIADRYGTSAWSVFAVAQENNITRTRGVHRTDLTGKRFGKWVVIGSPTLDTRSNAYKWLCKCDCGTERMVRSNNLVMGGSTCCGCSPWSEEARMKVSAKWTPERKEQMSEQLKAFHQGKAKSPASGAS